MPATLGALHVHTLRQQAFCRATRYWATYAGAAAQRARQASPSATGFKLSDMELLPIAKPCESVTRCMHPHLLQAAGRLSAAHRQAIRGSGGWLLRLLAWRRRCGHVPAAA